MKNSIFAIFSTLMFAACGGTEDPPLPGNPDPNNPFEPNPADPANPDPEQDTMMSYLQCDDPQVATLEGQMVYCTFEHDTSGAVKLSEQQNPGIGMVCRIRTDPTTDVSGTLVSRPPSNPEEVPDGIVPVVIDGNTITKYTRENGSFFPIQCRVGN